MFPGIIVVAEDETLVRMLAVDLLIDAGFKVIDVEDAAAALSYLEHYATGVSVLFTDVHMLGAIDGLGLARHAASHWPWLKFLIASGKARPTTAEMPWGSRFLPKPYLASGMVDEVRALSASPS